MKKRIFALAAAAVAALALGGVNLAGHAGTARADGPSGYGSTPGIAVGCVNSVAGTSPSLVQFDSTTLQQKATAAAGLTNVNNSFYLTSPGNILVCGVVLLGSNTATPLPAVITCPIGAAAAAPPYTCTATGPSDGNPLTVDTGTVTYTLTSPSGRFVIQQNNLNTITLPCAATLTNAEPPGFDQCVGAVQPGGPGTNYQPNPSLAINVSLAPGIPLSAFGTLSGIAVANAGGFSLTATYTRQAGPYSFTLTCTGGTSSAPTTCTSNTGFLPAGTTFAAVVPPATAGTYDCATGANGPCVYNVTLNPVGPSTATATVPLTLVAPTYGMYLTANPTTIPATPPSGGAVASGAAGGGSTITAVLYTATPLTGTLSISPGAITPTAPIPGQACTVVTLSSAVLTCGVEPGTVTFQTNLGVFGSPATPSASAQQTVSVACGVLPGSSLTGVVYNPATFGFGTLSFSSCTTASTTLYGGGSAGTATVVGTFVGAITGQTAQYSIAVAIAPAPASLSLTRGCNEVITPASLAAGSNVNAVVNGVSPSSAVVSVWQYNNATQKFNALYFNNPQAPVDQNTVGPSQSVFICVSGAATYATGAY